ncbi:MAG: choice-of-anchor I family protein [Pseudomonadota bacterium]
MRLKPLAALLAGLALAGGAHAAAPLSFNKLWTYNHGSVASEIPAYDSLTNTVWVAGVSGVDVIDATTGSLVESIDTAAYGNINSVSIFNGKAAMAFENSSDRALAGQVVFFDTVSRTQAGAAIGVGPLPDMLTFTPDGSKLLVANEGSPAFDDVSEKYSGLDVAGSVSIVDMNTMSVTTVGLGGVPQTGSAIRTGLTTTNLQGNSITLDFEPEYIAVNAAGTQAFVTLQEANAMGILDLGTQQFTSVVGLGLKDFNSAANGIDVNKNDGAGPLVPVDLKGLYQPDAIAAYQAGGQTYLVMANEGDSLEDGGDEVDAEDVSGATVPAGGNKLTVSAPDSDANGLVAFGGRSFSIRDTSGNIVFDSGNTLEAEAILRGIYADGRSDNKGVEPEGVELMEIGGRMYAFIGLERTTESAVAIYDITDPATASFVDMIVSTTGDVSPEGLKAFSMGGQTYLAIANEVSNTTSLYSLAPVPEPETWAMLLAGLGLVGFMARRKARRG